MNNATTLRDLPKEGQSDLQERRFNEETIEAMNDVLLGRNLHGPYKSAKEAVAAMMAD